MAFKKKLKLAKHAINSGILISLSTSALAATNSDTDTMVVTASGFAQQVKEAPATISVITPEEIDNKPYRDVTDALKDIPGVTITGGGDKTDISIRGMDAKYTLILVDGKKVSTRETRPNSDNSGFEQGWLPPLTAIERIEVVRGPMSSLYGSDAMGGVINIITKKVSDKWHTGLRLESVIPYRSKEKDTYTGSFSTMGPIIDDILGIQLYGQYSNRHEDEFLYGHAEQKLHSINGKLSLNATDTQKFDLDFGHALQSSKSSEGKTAMDGRESARNDHHNTFGLTHNGVFGDVTTTSYVSHEENNNKKRKMKIRNTDVDSRVIIPFSINMLTLGGKYNYQELHDKNNQFDRNITKIDRWNYAFFAEDEIHLLDNWILTTGLRYNKDENYGSNWNPRVYSVWNIDDNFTLKGGYSTGYATPQLRQVVSDWGQPTGGSGRFGRKGIVLGEPNLKPEKSNNYEIGFGYTNDYGIDASATVFYTKYKNKMQTYNLCNDSKNSKACTLEGSNDKFDLIQKWQNVDKADLKGLELSFKTPLFTDFLLSTNYSWTKTEQKTGPNKGRSLNRTPKQKFNTQLDWNVTQKWDLWTKIAYYGVESTTDRNGNKIEYPGYTFWDVGASYKIHKQAKLYAGIYNLFDKDVSNDDFGKTLEGRRYFVGTEINF